MAASTLDILKEIATEFEDEDEERLELFITLAVERVSPDRWSELRYRQAVAYLAAHLLSIASRDDGQPGPIVSEQAGQVSRAYGYSQKGHDYAATSYGREFLNLRLMEPKINPLSTNWRIDGW